MIINMFKEIIKKIPCIGEEFTVIRFILINIGFLIATHFYDGLYLHLNQDHFSILSQKS